MNQYLNYIKYYSIAIWELIVKYLYPIIFASLTILSPIKAVILTVGFLIACDFVVGIYRAFYLKEKITSRKMSNSISKMLLYQLMIIALFFIEIYLLESSFPIVKMAAVFICFVELKSMSESIELITGVDILKNLIKMLKRGDNINKDIINDLLDEEEKK